MSQTLLWLRVAPTGVVEWLCRDRQGHLLSGPGVCGGELMTWPQVNQAIVVWADESLLMRRAQLPSSGRSKWRTGLPYLAEDWVAGDVGELHVVAPPRLAGTETWVAVVERRRLDALQAQLRAIGMVPTKIVPEAAFLGPGRAADVLISEGHASFASTAGLAGVCEADLLPMVVGQDVESLRVLVAASAETYDGAQPIESALLWLSRQPVDDSLVDLLQGAYAPVGRDQVGGGWWQRALIVLLCALLVHTFSLALEVYQLKRNETQLAEQLEAQFRQVFGPDERMVDPAFQIRSAFARLGPSGTARAEALALLKGVAPLLTSDSRLVLQGFVYGDGTLEVAVRAPDATRFEGLREQLMLNREWQVEIGSTSYEGQEVIGRIRIRRGA